MPYESMPDLSELMREAAPAYSYSGSLRSLEKIPADYPARLQRSATFMVALCELFDTEDPESAFRDAIREMQHAAVEFGVNWTQEDRHGWEDVKRERAALGCPGKAGG